MMFRITSFIFSVVFFFLLGNGDCFAQKKKEKEEINWLSFSALSDSMANNPKKIFVEIYTDWCGPCKLMEKKVFPKRIVVQPMNENYYAVRLNAEKADSIFFNDSTYHITEHKTVKVNELVLEIGLDAGHLSYPTLVILDEKYKVIYRYPGMLNADLLNDVLETWK